MSGRVRRRSGLRWLDVRHRHGRRRAAMSFVGGGVSGCVDVVIVIIVIARDVAGLLGAIELGAELADDAALNHLAALRIDRMSDIGVELGAALGVAHGTVIALARAALVAVLRLKMIFRAALMAVAGELAAGHGDE